MKLNHDTKISVTDSLYLDIITIEFVKCKFFGYDSYF